MIAGFFPLWLPESRSWGTGDGGADATEARKSSSRNLCIFRPRPPSHTAPNSMSTVSDVTPKPTYLTRDSFWPPSVSSMKHTAPVSVQTTASLSETLATHVNVFSLKDPSKQFLPESAFGLEESGLRRGLEGDPGAPSASLQTLTCRIPTLLNKSVTIHHMGTSWSGHT